jgi:NAD(P)-dependent dehydrogenase (short-subunit alcohol dehydrogenase family)
MPLSAGGTGGRCGGEESKLWGPENREAVVNERDPRKGPTPADDVSEQEYPGREAEMEPEADHGEESYRGAEKLAGMTAIITGGDSGIGRAVAIAFAREGADIAFSYLAESEDADARETRRLVEEAGRRCLVERFDVRDAAACHDFVNRVTGEFGRLDVLVNNAAYQMSQEGIEDISEEQLDRTFRTNIYGYIYMVQAALPHLKEGAVILNTGSVTALQGNAHLIDYSATKGAIHVFTKSLAQSLSDRGIRVNCIAPGPVWTPLIPSTFPQEHVSSFGEDTYWGRPAQPAEIAPSFVFFASADGRYYSGEVLAPTGKGTTR